MNKRKKIEIEVKRLQLAQRINDEFNNILQIKRSEQMKKNNNIDDIQLTKESLEFLEQWIKDLIKKKPQETTFIISATRKWEEICRNVIDQDKAKNRKEKLNGEFTSSKQGELSQD